MYKGFVEQFVSEEMIEENGYCVFCAGEDIHTIGCLWRVAKEALRQDGGSVPPEKGGEV